jgi:hypothetical protein
MTTKDQQQEIIAKMRAWQRVENESMESADRIMQKTDNSIIRLVMKIIQRDSQMHYRVQEWIAESLESKTVTLNPEEFTAVWHMIEQHVEIEKKMTEAVEQVLSSLGDKAMPVQKYLLNYLADDENKHTHLLEHLEDVKKWMTEHPF